MNAYKIMLLSKLLIGVPMIIVGAVLIILPLIFPERSLFVLWFYGWPLIVIGAALLIVKGEDVIEQIHDKVEKVKGGDDKKNGTKK